MRIYGAGLAGLLAATMLRRHKPVVYEAQSSLPNNHDALLRFRSDAVSRETGIPFRKVTVRKLIIHSDLNCGEPRRVSKADLYLNNLYSLKVMGEVVDRSILNMDTVERFIAPPNLIKQLAHGLEIHYNAPLTDVPTDPREAVISTIPMPLLMKIAKWSPMPSFNYRTITTLSCDIVQPNVDVFQTIYYTGHEPWYRASLTGNHLIIELAGEPKQDIAYWKRSIQAVLADFGIHKQVNLTEYHLKVQRFGKIAPIPERERRQFILAMSDRYDIYSLGRYATWRNILLDDVVQDVKRVESFVIERDGYSIKLQNI